METAQLLALPAPLLAFGIVRLMGRTGRTQVVGAVVGACAASFGLSWFGYDAAGTTTALAAGLAAPMVWRRAPESAKSRIA